MNEQWSDRDAEDVLSSIRRLVSQRQPKAPAPEESEPERLVLTPSLRVPETELPADPLPLERAALDNTTWSLEDRIAELEDAVGGRPQEWEPDGSEDDEQETPATFVFQHRRPMIEPEPEPFRPQRTEGLVEAEEPPAAFTAEADAEAPEEAMAEPGAVEETPAVTETIAEAEPETAASEPQEADPALAALGAIDEDALRDLVAEIVREELQGELGVKITRNVRKLVRREIQLALAAHGLGGDR